MIRKSISNSDSVAALKPKALALFALLIAYYNAHGKMNGNPHFIKGEVCPKVPWLTTKTIAACLQEINDHTNVKWFQVKGSWYIHALSFDNHQDLRDDRMGKDELPDYSWSTPGVGPHEVEVEEEVEGKVEVEKKGARFTKPTPEEVTAYALSINYVLDGRQFCDFYESKGWKVGPTPMKNWQAAVRTWKNRGSNDNGKNRTAGAAAPKPGKYAHLER